MNKYMDTIIHAKNRYLTHAKSATTADRHGIQ